MGLAIFYFCSTVLRFVNKNIVKASCLCIRYAEADQIMLVKYFSF